MINFFGIVHACGGCGTEVLGAIELLRSKDVAVRMIVPIGDPIIQAGNPAADYLRALGVTLTCYKPGMFAKCKLLISFGEFQALEYMRKYDDRPGYVVFSDCMHFPTDNEIDNWRDGLIDELFFQTRALADRNGPQIAKKSGRTVKARSGYNAFVNVQSPYFPIRYSSSRRTDRFNVCRIVRDDPAKWHNDTWRMFCGVTAPGKTTVHVEIAGWGEEAERKIGNATDKKNQWFNQLNVVLHRHIHDAKAVASFYARQHVVMHVCDPGWEEAMSRMMLEAIVAGTVVITDNRGGAAQLFRDGETGFLVSHPDEAAFRASEMAFYPERRKAIAAQAYTELVTVGRGNPDVCWPWWKELVERGM